MVKINPRIVTKGRPGMMKSSSVPGIRVEPADDDMRRLLKHPTAGGFRAEGDIEWPNDTFTFRRLKEGSIKLSEQKQQDEEKPSDAPKEDEKPSEAPEEDEEPSSTDASEEK
jgi:hypothetical protein